MFENLRRRFKAKVSPTAFPCPVEFDPFRAPSPCIPSFEEAADRIDGRLRAMGFIPSERSAKLGTGSHPDRITYSLPKGAGEKIPARMVYVTSHVDDKRLRIIDLQFFDKTGVEVYKTNIFGFLGPNNSHELAKNMQEYSAAVKFCRAHGMTLSRSHPQ